MLKVLADLQESAIGQPSANSGKIGRSKLKLFGVSFCTASFTEKGETQAWIIALPSIVERHKSSPNQAVV